VLFTGAYGFFVHGLNGQIVIPILALVLLVISLFAKIPGGAKWAGGLFGLVVLQVLLGMFAHGAASLGILHGLNALALFAVAVMAGRRVSAAVEDGSRRRVGLQEQT
jgi:heme A synthase